MARKDKPIHITVPILDVDSVLPFNLDENRFSDEAFEKEKIKEEIKQFIYELELTMKEKTIYIGEELLERRFIEKYLFEEGGFIEFIIQKPLAINAHFTKIKHAKKYEKAVKKLLANIIPETPYREVFIDSIYINTKKDEHLTFEKWNKLHHFHLKNSVIFTLLAIGIAIIFEAIKAIVEIISVEHNFESEWVAVIGAIIIAFLFEPVKKRTEKLIDKYFFRN